MDTQFWVYGLAFIGALVSIVLILFSVGFFIYLAISDKKDQSPFQKIGELTDELQTAKRDLSDNNSRLFELCEKNKQLRIEKEALVTTIQLLQENKDVKND